MSNQQLRDWTCELVASDSWAIFNDSFELNRESFVKSLRKDVLRFRALEQKKNSKQKGALNIII